MCNNIISEVLTAYAENQNKSLVNRASILNLKIITFFFHLSYGNV